MKFFRRMPLQRKVLTTYLALVLLLLTVFFVFFLVKTAGDGRRAYTDLLQQNNETIDERLTTIMRDLKNTSSVYIATQKVVGYVENDFNKGKENYLETLWEMQANTLLIRVNPYVSSIAYVSHSGEWYSGAGENKVYYEDLQSFIRQMEAEGKANMLTPIYDTVLNMQNTATMTYGYTLMNTFTFQPVGYAFINLDLKKLEPSFQVLSDRGLVNTVAFQGDRVLYQDPTLDQNATAEIMDLCAQQAANWDKSDRMLFQGSVGGESFLCELDYCEAMDLTLFSGVSFDQVYEGTYEAIRYYLITVMVMLVIFLAMSMFLSVWITHPVRILQEGIEKVEKGALVPITEQTDRPDDMGMLIRSFNRMVEQLKSSLLREYELKDLQRKAQIKMLQSQINPHFLYNALNTIAAIAEIENFPEISDICSNLGDMFRYNISSKNTATLEEEVMQIQRYASIHKVSTAGNVSFCYQIDEAAQKVEVPRFLLQPLVENSVEHGFSGGSITGTITIAASVQDGYLQLSVADDGKGIEPERLEQLRSKMEDASTLYTERKEDNIGLLNVNFRVKSYYGPDCGMTLTSHLGAGTTVSLRIRIQ